jgi:hypothetical protein
VTEDMSVHGPKFKRRKLEMVVDHMRKDQKEDLMMSSIEEY